MLEAAGVYDPSADATGIVLSVLAVLVVWAVLAVKDRNKRG